MLNDGAGLRLRGGAKSKNHTAHNKNSKEHRNGIKRVKTYVNFSRESSGTFFFGNRIYPIFIYLSIYIARRYRNETTKFRAIKMWRNTKYARKGSMRIHRHNLQVPTLVVVHSRCCPDCPCL